MGRVPVSYLCSSAAMKSLALALRAASSNMAGLQRSIP